jgi:hypothetical protein
MQGHANRLSLGKPAIAVRSPHQYRSGEALLPTRPKTTHDPRPALRVSRPLASIESSYVTDDRGIRLRPQLSGPK